MGGQDDQQGPDRAARLLPDGRRGRPDGPQPGARRAATGDRVRRAPYLRLAQINQYLDCCAPHYRPLAALLIGTGARISEAIALRVDDVDLGAGTVRIHKQRVRGQSLDVRPTKGRNFRTVAIGPGLVGTLRDLLTVRAEHGSDDAGWLFLCPPVTRGRHAHRTDPVPPHRNTVVVGAAFRRVRGARAAALGGHRPPSSRAGRGCAHWAASCCAGASAGAGTPLRSPFRRPSSSPRSPWMPISAHPARRLRNLDPWYVLVLLFAVRLINPLDGPLGEEPGWRGFALPRLQQGRSPLHASLILGLLVAGRHVPLVFLPGERLAPVLPVATVAVTFVYTWIFNHTGENALLTLVAHAAEGVILLGALGLLAPDEPRLTVLYAAAWCATAVGLLVFDWRFWRGRSSSPQPAIRSLPLAGRA